jgi:hypothetical protein
MVAVLMVLVVVFVVDEGIIPKKMYKDKKAGRRSGQEDQLNGMD